MEQNANGLALVIHLESIADPSPSCLQDEKSPSVLSIIIHAPRGTAATSRRVIVSDSSGDLRVYAAKNGTLISTMQLDKPQTSHSMAKTGNVLAIGTGPDVSFVHASRADKVLSNCMGIVDTNIVSLAYDALIPSFLFAGLDSGEVIVFNTKYRAP